MIAYSYLSVFLVGLTFHLSHGCSDKNVIEALYACSKQRGDLNRVGKSAQSTHSQICEAFKQYVNCMEPRVSNCDEKLIEAYTIMKERYSMDGRFNCDASPTTPSTTTITPTTTTQPLTTEDESTLPPMLLETTEVTTTIPNMINNEYVITTAADTSYDDIDTKPTQSSSSRNWAKLHITAMASLIMVLLSLFIE